MRKVNDVLKKANSHTTELASILATPTNAQLALDLAEMRAKVATLESTLEAQSQVLTKGEPQPVITEEEVAKKREKVKKLWAIYTRRTKLVSLKQGRAKWERI